MLGSDTAAEDAAQEAFLRLWEHRDRWRSGSARAVVFRIGRNVALDQLRRAEVRRRWVKKRALEPPPPSPSPAADAAAAEFAEGFREAFACLPKRRREVFELVRFRGLSYAEVAEVMQVSHQTVANQMSLAMADLRRMLAVFLPGSQADRAHEAEARPTHG